MNWLNIVLSVLISTIAAVLSISGMSQSKLNLRKILFFFGIVFPLLLLNCLFMSGISKLIINILIMSFALYLTIFNSDISKSVYYTLVYEMLVFIVEIVLTSAFLVIFNYSLNSYNDFSYSLLIFSILNCSIVYLISIVKPLNKLIRNIQKMLSKSSKGWIYIIFIIVLMILLITFNQYNYKSSIEYFINVGMVIFIIMSLVYVISNKFQKENFENQYNQTMEHLYKYEKIINEQGKKNHEFNNQLMVIYGYANNPEKLKEYLSLVMQEHKGGQNYMVKQLGYFPEGGIKGLMYNKLSKMEENNIRPFLYINPNIKDIFETKFDLTTYRDITKLLGVFLDNAIDAAKDAEPKEIELEMKIDEEYLIISIGNTYNKNTNIDKIGKKGFSSKGIGHGFGLSIVKDIARDNDKIETFSDHTDKMFKQIVMIDLK